MKQIAMAAGLFVVFLLARNTFRVNAEAMPESPRWQAYAVSEARGRRLAVLEAQDQTLALKQQQFEAELERTGQALRQTQYRVDRVSADVVETESPAVLTDLQAERIQLLRKLQEIEDELATVVAERRQTQEEWSLATGLHAR